MKKKQVYMCSECGYELPKWAGQCPSCHEWNTVEEVKFSTETATQRRDIKAVKAIKLDEIDESSEPRFSSGIGELDRVLGGGIVKGSLTLVAGEPGIGKSTLLLQICDTIDPALKVLYVSGEESAGQIKLRARRLGIISDNLYILPETDLDAVCESILNGQYDLVFVDSIQTMCKSSNNSIPGSISQIRECTIALMNLSKSNGISVILVGHVNKEGAIAGPKVLEHMVDCVLYFEGERNSAYRILRADKNRFGSTNEIGVFDMGDKGLKEVPNPSQALLIGRPEGVPGSCITCVMEGSRPILAEIQALIAPSVFGIPRRTSSGIEYNRAVLLLSVMEKRANYKLGKFDAYINVIGGLKIEETAVNLAAVLAVASAYTDTPLPDSLAAFGEVGLTGELRAVSSCGQRLTEIARMGIERCIIPYSNRNGLRIPDGMRIDFAKDIHQACAYALKDRERKNNE